MSRIAVTFKHEGEQRGVAIGPVHVIDLEIAGGTEMIPFGEPVPGFTELGWMTKPQALAVARQHGVKLEEV